jgi:hypothetical protein
MKTNRLFGIAVLVTALVFSFTACDDGNGSGGGGGGGVSDGLTITGLPSGTCYVNIFPSGTDISTLTAAFAANNPVAYGMSNDGGNVFTLLTLDNEIWTGSGNFQVLLTTGSNLFRYATVSFSNGNGTVQYSSFTNCASEGLTIIGLPSRDYTSMNIYASGTDISTYTACEQARIDNKIVAYGMSNTGGNVLTLYTEDYSELWTGSGNLPVLDANTTPWRYTTVNFSNGIGTAQYSSFIAVTN